MGSFQKYDPFALSDSNDEEDKIDGHDDLYDSDTHIKKDSNSLRPQDTFSYDENSEDKESSSSFGEEESLNKSNDVNYIPVPISNNLHVSKVDQIEPFIPPPPKDPYPANGGGSTKQYKFKDNSVANLIAKASAKLMHEPINNFNSSSNSKLPLFGKRGKYFVPNQLRVRRQIEDQQSNLKSKSYMQEMFDDDPNDSFDNDNNQIDAPTTLGEHGSLGKKTNIYLPEPLDKRISLISEELIPFPKTIDIPKPSLAHIPQPDNVVTDRPKDTQEVLSINIPSRNEKCEEKTGKDDGAITHFHSEVSTQSHRHDTNDKDITRQQSKSIPRATIDNGESYKHRSHHRSPKRLSPSTMGSGHAKGTTRGRSSILSNNKNSHKDRRKESSSRRIILPDEGDTTFCVTRHLDPLPNIGRDPNSSNILYMHSNQGGPGQKIEGSGAKVKLAWPVDILKYTRTQPCITYACNPRQFNLNKLSSRKADLVVDVLMTWPRKPLYPELTFVASGLEQHSPSATRTSPETRDDTSDEQLPEAANVLPTPDPQPKGDRSDPIVDHCSAVGDVCDIAMPLPLNETEIAEEKDKVMIEDNLITIPNISPEREVLNAASPTPAEAPEASELTQNDSTVPPTVDENTDMTTTSVDSPSSKPVIVQETDLKNDSKPNDIAPINGPELAAIQKLLGANLLNSDLTSTLNNSLSPLLSVINNLVTLSLTNSPLLKSLSALLQSPGHIQNLINPQQPSAQPASTPSKEDAATSNHQVAVLQECPTDKGESQQPETSPGELMQDITSLLMAHITPTSSSNVEVGLPKSEVPSCVGILKTPSSTTTHLSSNSSEAASIKLERGEQEGGRERIVAFDLPLDAPSPPSPSSSHQKRLLSKGVKRKGGSKKGHNSPSPPPPPPPAPSDPTVIVSKGRSKKSAKKKDKKRRGDSESPPPPPPPPPPAAKEMIRDDLLFLSPRPQPPSHFTGLLPQASPYYYHQGVGSSLGQQTSSSSLSMYLTPHNLGAMYAPPHHALNYLGTNPVLQQQQQQVGLYSNQIDYVALNSNMNAAGLLNNNNNCINTTMAQSPVSPYNLLGLGNSLMMTPSQPPPLFMSPPPADKAAKILVSQYANPNLIRIATTQTFV